MVQFTFKVKIRLATTSYAKILSRIDTATDGDEAGVLFTSIPHQGTDRTFSYFEGGNGTSNGRVSFNYNAKDIDFGVLNQGTADGGPMDSPSLLKRKRERSVLTLLFQMQPFTLKFRLSQAILKV